MNIRLLAASLLFVAVSVHAEPASTESIENLLTAAKAEALLNSMCANLETAMRQGMAESLKGKKLDAKQQKLVDSMPAKMAQVMREEMSWSSMKPLYVQIYKDSFTQEEVDGLLAFYQSPAGQAMINKMPVVMQKSMVVVQQRMGPLMQKMEAAMKQSMEEAGISDSAN